MLQKLLVLLSILCYVNSFTISTLKSNSLTPLKLKMNNDLNSNDDNFNLNMNNMNNVFDNTINNDNLNININPAIAGSLLSLLLPVQAAYAKGKTATITTITITTITITTINSNNI